MLTEAKTVSLVLEYLKVEQSKCPYVKRMKNIHISATSSALFSQ